MCPELRKGRPLLVQEAGHRLVALALHNKDGTIEYIF
jgi:hypothetical protein